MRRKFLIIPIIFTLFAFFACEKNDPLADQGELTGNVLPYNLLAQMPDGSAGDTLTLRTITWAIDDNIDSVMFYHHGFKLRDFEVKIEVSFEDSLHTMSTAFVQDSIFTDKTLIASYPQEGKPLNDFYQTQQNAYVIEHDFIVPENYMISTGSDEDVILNMDDDIFSILKDSLANQINRSIFRTFFPEINGFSLDYFIINEQGFYTGEVTEQALQYFHDNITRENLSQYVSSASVNDETRVTVESSSSLDTNDAEYVSERTFKVI